MKKRFCHECGTNAALDAAFCEECGVELRPLPGAQTPPSPHRPDAPPPHISTLATRSPPKGRALAVLGGIVAVLAAGGGAAWFALAPKPATEAELRAASEDWLKTQDATRLNRPCVQNFNYRANQVLVNPEDSATQEWLAPLVKAGIYTAPSEAETGNSWQPIKLRYEKGPEASRYLVGGQLCAATQLQVSKVSFDAKAETLLGKLRVQTGSVSLAWQDRAPWSQESPLKSEFDGRFSEQEKSLAWVREKNGWRVINSEESKQLQREAAKLERGELASPQRAAGFSFSRFFSGLFSFGDTPEKAVESFFHHLERGNAQEASDLLYGGDIPKAKVVAMLAANRAAILKRGGIERIESTDLGGDDDTRRLRSTITYRNGRSETKETSLIKENGRWLLTTH